MDLREIVDLATTCKTASQIKHGARYLSTIGRAVGDIDTLLRHVPGTWGLTDIKLRYVDNDAIATVIQKCPKLESLEIEWVSSPRDISALALPNACPALERLGIQHADWESTPYDNLDNIVAGFITNICTTHPRLTYLDLGEVSESVAPLTVEAFVGAASHFSDACIRRFVQRYRSPATSIQELRPYERMLRGIMEGDADDIGRCLESLRFHLDSPEEYAANYMQSVIMAVMTTSAARPKHYMNAMALLSRHLDEIDDQFIITEGPKLLEMASDNLHGNVELFSEIFTTIIDRADEDITPCCAKSLVRSLHKAWMARGRVVVAYLDVIEYIAKSGDVINNIDVNEWTTLKNIISEMKTTILGARYSQDCERVEKLIDQQRP
jgi:hypothetical protein